MTSTGFNAGLSANAKNSCKVLKPPGGGSSDIFGGETPSTPRHVKNHMKSNIFAEPESMNKTGDKPRRVQPIDSYNRLFGEPNRPNTAGKNHMRSNIPIGSDGVDGKNGKPVTNGKPATNGMNGNGHHVETNGKAPMVNGNGVAHTNGHGNGHHETGISKNGNPVTGEGYMKPATGEINTQVPSLNGGGHVINKNRIPPGGFSSGLW